MFWFAQVSALHVGLPHWFAVPPPPQVSGDAQPVGAPHVRRLPQPSGTLPQFAVPQLPGVQLPPPPQRLATPPPPQVCGAVHGLQYAVWPPHPSLWIPQVPAG
jgi:hypothetical protein